VAELAAVELQLDGVTEPLFLDVAQNVQPNCAAKPAAETPFDRRPILSPRAGIVAASCGSGL
jgi:hypothetical protein